MIDKKFFTKLKKDYDSYDIGRRIIIRHSSDILKFAKQAIFALHRENLKEANAVLNEAEKLFKYLETKIKKEEGLKYEGVYLAAVEEFIEAKLFEQWLKTGKIGAIKGYDFEAESYLGGICDFTGEIVRRAIFLATKRRYKEVEKCWEIIDAVIHELIQFNLIGNLRPKYDQAKNNLRKIEEIMYDLEIKKRH
jgi:predicted translin family RNA/ssDNA-binding protein